ncbi:hypothetical protein BY996DRAFT_6529927 [Phakopsora pachyrhizi]|nr:hypothetical protein BY996DRAFT_6529927 [Phakopsora pachyrhizi]
MQTGAGGKTDLATGEIAKVHPNIDEKVSTSPEIHSYFGDPIRPEQSLLSNRCLVGVRCSQCLRRVDVEVSDQDNQERQEREKVLERIRGLITTLRTKRKSDKHHSHLNSDQDTEEGFTNLQFHSSKISSSKCKEEELQKLFKLDKRSSPSNTLLSQSIDKNQKGISDSLSSSNSWPTVQLFEKLRKSQKTTKITMEISSYLFISAFYKVFETNVPKSTKSKTSSSILRRSKYHSHEDPKGINKEYYFEEERAKDEKSKNKSESEVEGMDMAKNQCVLCSRSWWIEFVDIWNC